MLRSSILDPFEKIFTINLYGFKHNSIQITMNNTIAG